MITLNESGMVFKFPDNDCFLIERDAVAKKPHAKVCECLAHISRNGKDKYAFIEAKRSAPKEKVCDRSKVFYDSIPMEES